MRYNDIRVLKRHIDEVNELFASSTTGADHTGHRHPNSELALKLME